MILILKQIYRKSQRYKLTSIINLFGLTISFGIAILLLMYVQHEFSYDNFHSKKDRIVRLVVKENGSSMTSPPVGEWLADKFPEIKNFNRTRHNETCVLTYKGVNYLIKGNMLMDSSVFDMFDFELMIGNEQTALSNPFSVILTEKIAQQIFGEHNPIGEILTFNNSWDYTITGVMKDLPDNSTFDIDILFPFHALKYQWKNSKDDPYNVLEQKYNQSFHTYLLFDKKTDLSLVEAKMCPEIMKEFNTNVKFQKLENIYFDTNRGDRWLRKGNRSMVFIIFSIAIGMIVISIFNYINLNSASAVNYLPTLGIRKMIGSGFFGLIQQFLVENTLYLTVTFILGLGFSSLIKPFLNNILNCNLSLSAVFENGNFVIVLTGLILLILISSMYPVWLTTRKVSAVNLKNKQSSTGMYGIRNLLIPAQFILTIVFIIAALSINKQMIFIKNTNLGFDNDHLLYLIMNTEKGINTDFFKEEALKDPNIKSISYSAGLFGDIRRGSTLTIDDRGIHFNRIYTDADYIPTMGYEIVKGRNFMKTGMGDIDDRAYIINETMLKQCEFKNPLDKKIYGHPIVGIVKDFHIMPLQNKITPIAIVCAPQDSKWVINIKLSGTNIKETLSRLEKVWNKVSPDFPMLYYFANERIMSYYNKEKQFAKLSFLFSILSVILSCIGLIGLAVFTIQNKTKEIGIRKVNGAKESEILAMLNSGFIKWIIIAIIIACPLAYSIIKLWLKNFAYQTELNWWVFALAGILVSGTALVTVSWQSWIAARKNPVEALRYE